MDRPELGKCRGCGADVRFARTVKGKWTPLEMDPDPNGNQVFENGIVRAAKPEDTAMRWMPHWANCPFARAFRQK